MLSETEKYLIEAIQKGDYKLFGLVFRKYYPFLCKYAIGIVHNTETAKDLVSEVFVSLWESSKRPNIHTSLKGYLIICVRNSCINYLRRSRKHFLEINHETINKLHALLLDFKDVPPELLVKDDLEGLINSTVEKLPSECRKIFLLYNKDLLTYNEIADMLNISESTVKVQIFRAMSKLRNAIREYIKG